MIVELLFSICLSTLPCEERRIAVYDPAVSSPMACLLGAQSVIAEWATENYPGVPFTVEEFKCRTTK